MNKEALTKHAIYQNLNDFSEHDLIDIANFINSLRQKKKLKRKNVIRLQGVLKDCNIDFSGLKKIKEDSWRHLEEEYQDD